MEVVYFILLVANALVAVPVLVFAVEVIVGSLPARKETLAIPPRKAFTVVVPAHNEAGGIGATVASLMPQLSAADRLIVVADNCTDSTAQEAREAGAEVIERNDPDRRGKGYALDFAIRALAAKPPEAVVFVDADCRASPGSLELLTAEACAQGRPVQSRYLMIAPEGAGMGVQIAEFAFAVKNFVRPLGLKRLGLPCQITGAGMAFPWAIIARADLATGHLVEDMKLGLDLALAGTPTSYEARAGIESYFPHSASGLSTQRSRWEEGHLTLIATALAQVPRAIKAKNGAALALVLDTLVPPLTLLLMLVTLCLAATGALTFAIGLPAHLAWLSAAVWALLLASVSVAWLVHGRGILPPGKALGVLPFALGKAKLYLSLARGKRSASWVRTDRKRPD